MLSYQQANPHLRRWVVAYSGGVDSTVLLHAVYHANRQLPIPCAVIAVHVNHQLCAESHHWQAHCETFIRSLPELEWYTQMIEVKRSGQGIEAAARQARYSVFESLLKTGDCLLLGHHQQDQAETLMLRLLRGAGVRGLSAMRAQRRLGEHDVLRPLLAVDKETIIHYAQQHQLAWVDDASNDEDSYDRNFLRQHIFPSLQTRWSAIYPLVCDTALRMQQADIVLTEVAQSDIHTLRQRKERYGHSLLFSGLAALSLARRNNVLRYWCEQQGYPALETTHFEQIQQQFFRPKWLPTSACVSWKGYELRQFNGRLYIMPSLPTFSGTEKPYRWSTQTSLSMGVAGDLQLTTSDKGLLLPQASYEVRWRQGGERCTPAGRQHSQTLKKLLQEQGLETWLRDRVPLLYCDNTLAAVGDLWVNQGFSVAAGQASVRVVWKLSMVAE